MVEFLKQAARDPEVLAIKMTLYRTGTNSPIVAALLDAAIEYGKQVAVLVELKARFDEESNIEWARALEREGVHVVYGLVGLKVHSKVALVVRREGDVMRRYPFATGNYNSLTARFYTDIGMLTADEEIGADVTDLFNFLTGYSAKTEFRKLLVAPEPPAPVRADDRPRDQAPARARRRAPHLQDQCSRGSADNRASLPGVSSGREDRFAGSRTLLLEARLTGH